MITRKIWSGWLIVLILESNLMIQSEATSEVCDEEVWFLCKRSGKCISKSFICDGEVDCGEGDTSDEDSCHLQTTSPPVPCNHGEFQCTDGLCVPVHWVCDGEVDCMDGSDETVGCDSTSLPVPCNHGEFQCTDGHCVPVHWFCDGEVDCMDGSDETVSCDSTSLPVPCNHGEFQCTDGHCVPVHWFCDGEVDCMDGSDETVSCDSTSLPVPCNHGGFQCTDGLCVPVHWVCDGEVDCMDGSDETVGCDSTSLPVPCNHGGFQCTDGLCVPVHWVCDGEVDCMDGSDETVGCDSEKFKCDGFQCKVKTCIPKEWECDGVRDCVDNSDEAHCRHKELPLDDCDIHNSRYLCSDGKKCINLFDVCNSHPDCDDASDEGRACYDAEACHHKNCTGNEVCSLLPSGAICRLVCTEGYKYKNYNCEDVNECLNFGTCDQTCHNTVGGYNCSCVDGYEYVPERKMCKASGAEGLLLFSSNDQVRSYFITSRVYYQIAQSLPHATGIAYDGINVYWTTVADGEEAIVKSTEHGENQRVIVTSGLGRPEDLAIDWVTRSLYFTDSKYKHIAVCSNDGLVCTILNNRDIDKPRAIVLHPSEGLMYWTDWGQRPMIARSGMDGSQPFEFVIDNIHWPNGLSLDLPTERLYWVDAKEGSIECIHFDGSDRRKIPSPSVKHPYSIEVFENKIYWSDWDSNQIEACDKYTGHDCHVIVKERTHKIYGIHIYHPSMHGKSVVNPCYEQHCSDLCLLAPRNQWNMLGYTCVCPHHKKLSQDNHTCVDNDALEAIVVGSGQKLVKVEHKTFGGFVTQTETIHFLRKIGALTHDPISDDLFISDLIMKVIIRYNWKEKKSETLVEQVGRVVGMDVDYFGNNLYWVDEEKKTIEVLSLKGKHHKVLLRDFGDEIPTDIALVLESGYMFIASQNNAGAHIDRITLDGRLTSRTHVVETGLIGPISLFYDHHLARLFWADRNAGLIKTTDSEGIDRHLYKEMGSAPLEVATLDNDVFWTTYGSNKLFWANKMNADIYQKEFIIEDIVETDQMKLISIHSHSLHRVDVCALAGNCSHMCLLSGRNTVCACPDGMELSFNKETCHVQLICKEDEFKCKSGVCISRSLRCNGHHDCKDGDDEEHCPKICPQGDFACVNGRQCVSHTARCDSKQDCDDGSDEHNCDLKATCSENEFHCGSGECIPIIGKCDTNDDCTDASDEQNCAQSVCHGDDFRCASGSCIPKSWVCDRQIDCSDGSDEGEKCHKQEKCKDFTCENGHCISENLKCNGEDDCEDMSDEANCPSVPSSTASSRNESVLAPGSSHCPFSCLSEPDVCLPLSAKCDGKKDCPRGEDEESCSHCNEEQFSCASKKCIPKAWVCDNINDCGDNSDEQHCTNKSIEMFTREHHESKHCDGYHCPGTEICLSLQKTCDSHPDCPDGSDEKGLCASGGCDHAGCSHLCQETPEGPRCKCRPGYKLSGDGKDCNDINECQRRSTCSQVCHNTLGSYRCSCLDPHYHLRADKITCKAKGSEMKYIYATENAIKYKAQSLQETGQFYRPKKYNLDISGMDVDIFNNNIYWSSELSGHLIQMSLDHKSKVTQLSHLVRPTKISVDWATGNVYLLENSKEIKACSFKINKCASIYKSDNDITIESFAIDPVYRFMFWVEATWFMVRHAKGTIKKSSMAGGNVETIVDLSTISLGDLTVDYIHRLVYWSDKKEKKIERCTYDGRDREVVVHSEFPPKNLMIFEDNIYWLNEAVVLERVERHDSSGLLTKYGLYGASFMKYEQVRLVSPTTPSRITSVVLHQEALQPEVHNNCTRVQCNELCVMGLEGVACLCENGVKIQGNMQCPQINESENRFHSVEHHEVEHTSTFMIFFWWLFSFFMLGTLIYFSYFVYNQKYKNMKITENVRVWFPVSRLREEERTQQETNPTLAPGQHQYENPIFTVVT